MSVHRYECPLHGEQYRSEEVRAGCAVKTVEFCRSCRREESERLASILRQSGAVVDLIPDLKRRISEWLRTRFGDEVRLNRHERAARVLEEAAELAQAEGVDRAFADRILARVFSRPRGNPYQEAAGVAVTLLAWSATTGADLDALALAEVERIERLPVEHFRQKHAEKAAAGTALAGTPPGTDE